MFVTITNAYWVFVKYLFLRCLQVDQKISLKELGLHLLSSCTTRVIQFVGGGQPPNLGGSAAASHSPNLGLHSSPHPPPLAQDLVWVATDDKRLVGDRRMAIF